MNGKVLATAPTVHLHNMTRRHVVLETVPGCEMWAMMASREDQPQRLESLPCLPAFLQQPVAGQICSNASALPLDPLSQVTARPVHASSRRAAAQAKDVVGRTGVGLQLHALGVQAQVAHEHTQQRAEGAVLQHLGTQRGCLPDFLPPYQLPCRSPL